MFKRYGPPILVTLLLLATGVAFAVTEHLKLTPPTDHQHARDEAVLTGLCL